MSKTPPADLLSRSLVALAAVLVRGRVLWFALGLALFAVAVLTPIWTPRFSWRAKPSFQFARTK